MLQIVQQFERDGLQIEKHSTEILHFLQHWAANAVYFPFFAVQNTTLGWFSGKFSSVRAL